MKAYPITPVPAPRQTRAEVWKKRPCVLRYRAFKDACREHGVDVGESTAIVFRMPMPPSWSAKKRRELNGHPHQQKPDIDNLIKALFDAVHKEDEWIHTVTARKVWAVDGEIEVENH